jgi:hypothetical protein
MGAVVSRLDYRSNQSEFEPHLSARSFYGSSRHELKVLFNDFHFSKDIARLKMFLKQWLILLDSSATTCLFIQAETNFLSQLQSQSNQIPITLNRLFTFQLIARANNETLRTSLETRRILHKNFPSSFSYLPRNLLNFLSGAMEDKNR